MKCTVVGKSKLQVFDFNGDNGRPVHIERYLLYVTHADYNDVCVEGEIAEPLKVNKSTWEAENFDAVVPGLRIDIEYGNRKDQIIGWREL